MDRGVIYFLGGTKHAGLGEQVHRRAVVAVRLERDGRRHIRVTAPAAVALAEAPGVRRLSHQSPSLTCLVRAARPAHRRHGLVHPNDGHIG